MNIDNEQDFGESEKYNRHTELCIKCGLCTQFCPIYKEEGDEKVVARGKNKLINERVNNITITEAFIEAFSKCLVCNRCSMYCPRGINTSQHVISARADIVGIKGLPKTKSIAFHYLLKDRIGLVNMAKAASKFNFLIPQNIGIIRHIPDIFYGLGRGRVIPKIAKKYFREEVESHVYPPHGVERKMRIGLFTGCAIEFLYPHVGKKIVNFLTNNGVEVVIPKEQGCCGIAVYSCGDINTAREMANNNIRAFCEGDFDYILTGCATCGSALKEGYLQHLAETGTEEMFKTFSRKVRDITEFIIDVLKPKADAYRSALSQRVKVTYHDPCHLVRYQGIKEQPRMLINNIPDIDYVEMDGADECCGMGGSFSIDHYELSKTINDNKIRDIASTDADVVVTACPGCMIHINDGLVRNKMKQKVMHIMDLLS